jgi:pimeloyl-ACP methyl ester carboxylesterase
MSEAKPAVSRRKVLAWGLGGLAAVAAAGTAGVEAVLHDVLPGHSTLDRIDGACSVPATRPTSAPPGPVISGRFASKARRRTVGYSIAYPPGHASGNGLPLVVALHGYGGNHTNALAGLSLQEAAALEVGGRLVGPMAVAAVDGGGGYWHAQPGDDPMGMLVDEFIPLCQALGAGTPPQRTGVLGISMGGYGALLLAEQHPRLTAAVAAISPAVWTAYSQAHSANAGAFTSAQDFAANNIITHAKALTGIPVRISSGRDDPFHPGVEALISVLPTGATVSVSKGCHTDSFEASQQPDALAFLAHHLIGARSSAR